MPILQTAKDVQRAMRNRTRIRVKRHIGGTIALIVSTNDRKCLQASKNKLRREKNLR